MKAFYLEFRRGAAAGSGVGGPPVVQPSWRPWGEEDDDRMGLLLQLEVDGMRLRVPGVTWLQIYQSTEEGDDPQPQAVLISDSVVGAGREAASRRRPLAAHPGVSSWSIDFTERDDPLVLPDLARSGPLFLSKLGGLDPWAEHFPDLTFLGQIHSSPVGFNFGGLTCGLYRRCGGEIRGGEVVARLR